MTSYFQSTNQALLAMAVEALASAPHLTQAQKKTRTEAVINAIMAFLPTEPVQTMLASQAVGHHFTLLDTFREIANRALTDNMSMRLRAITAMETKMMLALLRELRVVRADARAAAESEQAEAAAAQDAAAPPVQPEQQPSGQAETVDDATFHAHIADFEKALADLYTTLEEARALDQPTARKAAGLLEPLAAE